MQAESERLKCKLRNAEVTEELKRRAEQRATELESAIAATRDRARETIRALEQQK